MERYKSYSNFSLLSQAQYIPQLLRLLPHQCISTGKIYVVHLKRELKGHMCVREKKSCNGM